jgi:hypothetical protein
MQTAVEKLLNMIAWKDGNGLWRSGVHGDSNIDEEVTQAIAMEKEQIMKAWNDHKFNKWGNENTVVNGEDYYNQTYKSEYDLFHPEPEMWVNVYENNNGILRAVLFTDKDYLAEGSFTTDLHIGTFKLVRDE